MCDKTKKDDDPYIYMIKSRDPETGWEISEFLTQEEMDELENTEPVERYDPVDDYD